MVKKALLWVVLMVFVVSLAGCAVGFYKSNPHDKVRIEQLRSEVERLEELRAQEIARLEEAMADLKKRLKKELQDKQVRLDMAERGLVITFGENILFDSGKAAVRKEAYAVLDKVANVIKDKVPDQNIGVEGYTDNIPITYSGWKSNWELSTARATSVLHYLVNQGGLKPEKLSAIGYGEYKPVAANDTEEGRQLNRRVEVVILSETAKSAESEAVEEPFTENIK